MLYASCASGDTGIDEFGVCEIAVATGKVRFTRVFDAGTKEAGDGDAFLTSLAPDGSMVAAPTTLMDEKHTQQKDRALWVVDLRSPQRTVTKIVPPGLAQSKSERKPSSDKTAAEPAGEK